MVRDNTFWEAVELPVVVKKESGCFFYCDRCVRRNEVYSLGDGIYDSHDSVMSGITPYKSLGKISDDLHPNNQNNQLERRAWLP